MFGIGKKEMMTLSKTCPICKETWVVRHNWRFLGEIFIRTDFAIAMFDHLQTHTDGKENRVKCYEYNKGVSCEA